MEGSKGSLPKKQRKYGDPILIAKIHEVSRELLNDTPWLWAILQENHTERLVHYGNL